MLYKFIIDNYRSFGKETGFSMFPNGKRTFFPEHVYTEGAASVLKQTLIVGPNGCGKTNLFSAMAFLKRFATTYDSYADTSYLRNWYYENRFRLPVSKEDVPICLKVEFLYKNEVFIYSISLDGNGVKVEALYQFSNHRQKPALIMMRTRERMEFHKSLKIAPETVRTFNRQLQDNPNSSVLAINKRMELVSNQYMADAYEWLSQKFEVCLQDYSVADLLNQYCRMPGMLKFTNALIQKMNLGIKAVNILEQDLASWIENSGTMDTTMLRLFANKDLQDTVGSYATSDLWMLEKDGRKVVRELLFEMEGNKNYSTSVKMDMLSSGCRHILTLLAVLYRSIHSDTTMVMDNFDCGLNHGTLWDLAMLFHESASKGQLLYLANNLSIMSQQDMFRLDELWMMKKEKGLSQMIHLDKINIKKQIALEKGYMDDRFGCRPEQVSIRDIAGID